MIDRVGDLRCVIKRLRVAVNVIQAVLLRILRHYGDGHNYRDIVAGLFWQDIPAVEFPEIGVSGALHSAWDCARARVVRPHGQIPIAKLVVEVSPMTGGGAGRFLRILSLIHPTVMVYIVSWHSATHT